MAANSAWNQGVRPACKRHINAQIVDRLMDVI